MWRVRLRQTVGGVGVPTRPGGRRREAGSAAVNRVAAIDSGSASGGRPSKRLARKPPRPSARVSAQRRLRKNLLVPVRAATSCSFPHGPGPVDASVRACAARLCDESCSVRRAGDSGVKGCRPVAAEFRLGGRKYVVTYFRSLLCGLRLSPCCGALRQQFFKTKDVRPRATGKER